MTSWSRLKRHVIVQLRTHVCDNSSAQAQTRPVPWMFSWELTLVITSLLDSAVFQPLARYFLPPVSALTARLARVCLLLLGGSLATSLPFFSVAPSCVFYSSLIPVVSARLSSPSGAWCGLRVTSHRGTGPSESAAGPRRSRALNPAMSVPYVGYTPPSLPLPHPAPQF